MGDRQDFIGGSQNTVVSQSHALDPKPGELSMGRLNPE
jgi:hypothetical protein